MGKPLKSCDYFTTGKIIVNITHRHFKKKRLTQTLGKPLKSCDYFTTGKIIFDWL
ncbi:hypothetical protein MuYL_3703 [Mucilaginibacter xinganensis]|uniref:Uncharacterized protein n=1 Tax=Mucilaginibacter xinganensis TaxID=1234841 RepID=A0A223P178_9SPHI|nr:hypothetical protein MuYL_3703 [Mucilaginibacter xinganensis]